MPIDGTIPPPAIYDHQPNIPVIEYILTSTEANKVCIRVMNGEAGQGRVWQGCARIVGKAICYVWRINDPEVKRHEQAHCSGWSNNHETEAELKLHNKQAEPKLSATKLESSIPKAPSTNEIAGSQLLPWPENAPVVSINQFLEMAKNRR